MICAGVTVIVNVVVEHCICRMLLSTALVVSGDLCWFMCAWIVLVLNVRLGFEVQLAVIYMEVRMLETLMNCQSQAS